MEAYQKERMLLGAVINDPASHLKLLRGMGAECFSGSDTKAVYEQILRLSEQGKPIDPTMIAENCTALDSLQVVNLCIALVKEGSPWHAEQYAKDLKELGRKRKLYKLFRHCADRLMEEDIQTVVDECREGLRTLGAQRGGVTYMSEVAQSMFDRMEAICNGEITEVKTGLPDLDAIIGGLSGGDLVIIGARPAVGKSTFGMAIALAASRAGKQTLVCSCEMSDVQYAQRIASEITGISSLDLKKAKLSPDQWALVGDAMHSMSQMRVGFTFRTTYVEDLYSQSIAEKDGKGLDLLVVDYLQIMDTKSKYSTENEQITKISKKLKALAMELQIPVVALAQVKRQDSAQLRMPTLQELRGSGSLEQDADKVIFLHRVVSASDPYCRSADALQRFRQQGDQMIAVEVAKHRDGPTGSFCTRFEPRRMKYTCLTHREG